MKRRLLCILIALVLLFSFSLASVAPAAAATPPTQAEINTAIERGLAYLAKAQSLSDGSWVGGDPGTGVGVTGIVVLKFEERAKDLGKDPFDTSPTGYQYAQNVISGLDYILKYANSNAPAEPGYHFPSFGQGTYSRDNYSTGIAMAAIAASNSPSRVVSVGALSGKTYLEVVQGMMDWMANAQHPVADTNLAGGWGYYTQQPGWADNSNSGYSTLGIGYAAAGFGVTIPGSVTTLLPTWINTVQRTTGNFTGGSIYRFGDSVVNTLKTGNLLYQLALVGKTINDPQVQMAIGFIGNYWAALASESNDGGGWMGDYQAMFLMMKGLDSYGVIAVPGFLPYSGFTGNITGTTNWFGDVSRYIVDHQNLNNPLDPLYGSWLSTNGEFHNEEMNTAWALLTLERDLPPVDLSITKTDNPDPVLAGDILTYTITVTNNGASDATGVTVTDILPPDVTLIGESHSMGTWDAANKVWHGFDLANGDFATFTLRVRANSSTLPGTIINTATVGGAQHDPNPTNNTANEQTRVIGGVPGVSQWGILALAVLFGSTMVWMIRRRLIRREAP